MDRIGHLSTVLLYFILLQNSVFSQPTPINDLSETTKSFEKHHLQRRNFWRYAGYGALGYLGYKALLQPAFGNMGWGGGWGGGYQQYPQYPGGYGWGG